jgi:hypothetical protein
MIINIIDIFNYVAPKLYNFNNNYISRKYTEAEYFQEIINFLRNSVYWQRYNGRINGKVLNNKHNFYTSINLYNKIYEYILDLYFRKCKTRKLKYQSVDSSFIPNKFGCNNIGRNKYYRNKRGIKIYSIVDSYGIPISTICINGKMNDCKLFSDLFDQMMINPETIKYKNINKYKQYFMADSAFDTKKIINKLNNNGYNVLIEQNRRKIKDSSKLRKLNNKQKKHYTNRIKIENSYSWSKMHPVINMMYEKTTKSYLGLLFLQYSIFLVNRLTKYPNGIV